MRTLCYTEPRKAEIVDRPKPEAKGKVSVAKTLFTSVGAGMEMAFYRGTAPMFFSPFDRSRVATASGDKQGKHVAFESTEGGLRFPMYADDPRAWFMGYDAVGKIVEVGPEEQTLKEGDLVFIEGSHKEYQASDRFFSLPARVNGAHASLLSQMRIAFNGMLDAQVRLMDTVVIFGMGTLGQLLLQMCRLSGAGSIVVVDYIQSRLEIAKSLGADATFNPAKDGDIGTFVQDRTGGRGANVVIEVSGNVDALQDAIRCCGREGTVTVMSFYQKAAANLKLGMEFHHKRITLRSSQVGGVNPACSRFYDYDRLLQTAIPLLDRLNLDPLISHRVKFEALPQALQMIDQKPQDCLSVVVEYE